MNSMVYDIAMASLFCGTAIVIVFLALVFAAIRGRGRRRTLSDDEGELIQQLWDGLQKMEGRIVNLETILLSRKKAQDFEKKL